MQVSELVTISVSDILVHLGKHPVLHRINQAYATGYSKLVMDPNVALFGDIEIAPAQVLMSLQLPERLLILQPLLSIVQDLRRSSGSDGGLMRRGTSANDRTKLIDEVQS